MKLNICYNMNLFKIKYLQVFSEGIRRNLLKIMFINCILLALIGQQSCSKMNDLHKPYLDEGEYIYAEKVDTVEVGSGNERIQLKMHINSESIKTARIFWNNNMDSVDVDINFQKGVFNKIITDLNEQQYIFRFITFDGFGNKSLPYETEGVVYGSNYQNTISNRTITSLTANSNNEIIVNWAENFDEKLDHTTVLFTDINGAEITNKVLGSDLSNVLTDFSSDLKYNTGFLPDSTSIDFFYTDFVSVNTDRILLDVNEWSIEDFSSEHPGGDNTVRNFIDGNQGTRWHSCAGCSSYPHWVVINLGGDVSFSSVEIFRTTFEGGDSRAPDKFQLEVSTDNATWVDLGTFDFDRFSDDGQIFPVDLSGTAHYLRFTGTEGPENNMVLGAIQLLK